MIKGIDEDNDSLYYFIDWGDGSNSGWIGPFENAEETVQNHSWKKQNTYEIRVKSKDIYGEESNWTRQQITLPFHYNLKLIPSFLWYVQRLYSYIQS